MKVLLWVAAEAATLCCFFQAIGPPNTFFSEHIVTNALKSFKDVLLTEGIIDEDNKLPGTNDVFVPASQSCHSPMTCFGLSKKSFVVVVGTGDMRVVVASKEPFPKAFCVAHEVFNHELVGFFGVRLLEPIQKTIHL
nr:hypothetical protein [Paenibacillus sp.]